MGGTGGAILDMGCGDPSSFGRWLTVSSCTAEYDPSLHNASMILTLCAATETRGAPGTEVGQPAADLDPDYQGYNPKVHGSYDPNAPYAQFHRQRMEDEEELANPSLAVSQPIGVDADYATAGTFNRFTGAYQTEDKSADRHNDANKSNRQLNAFFDVDAAANAHEGKSLKAERQQQKLSKKEIKELSEKRRAKKEKKRMDFYRT